MSLSQLTNLVFSLTILPSTVVIHLTVTLCFLQSGQFELQARTGKASKSDGSQVQATVFVAFAVKDESSRFQVELSADLTSKKRV